MQSQSWDNSFLLSTVSHSSASVCWKLKSILSLCNLAWGGCRERKDLLSICANSVPVSNAVLLLHKDLGSYARKELACMSFNMCVSGSWKSLREHFNWFYYTKLKIFSRIRNIYVTTHPYVSGLCHPFFLSSSNFAIKMQSTNKYKIKLGHMSHC